MHICGLIDIWKCGYGINNFHEQSGSVKVSNGSAADGTLKRFNKYVNIVWVEVRTRIGVDTDVDREWEIYGSVESCVARIERLVPESYELGKLQLILAL